MNALSTAVAPFVYAPESLADIEFVSFDTETTGLSPIVARLVELSGVKFKLGSATCETFSSLINPETDIPPEVTAVHGITNEMVQDAPTCAEVVPAFFDWVGHENTVLVAHNAPFDIGFLKVAVDKLRLPLPKHQVVDTLTLSRALLPDAPNHQLGTLVQYLELPEGGYHRALADSHHVRNVLQKISDHHSLDSWQTICDLYAVLKFENSANLDQAPPELQGAIDLLNEAMTADAAVHFHYNGFKTRRRKVKPTAVIQNRGNFYMIAFCYYFEAERTFRIDKMANVAIIDGNVQASRR